MDHLRITNLCLRAMTAAFPGRFTAQFFFCLALITLIALPGYASDSNWVRPGKAGDPLIWGRKDGIVFGLPSEGGLKGPRGLIRVGIIGADGTPQLLNYIAIEPVVLGPGSRFSRMAFSELEPSVLDPGERGKRLWVAPDTHSSADVVQGDLRTLHAGASTIERLSVRIDVEPFTANGAHVYLVASLDSDHPKELRLSVFGESDSPPIEELSVTATMGNYERLRWLWLKDRVEDSRNIFSYYTGNAFVELENYPLDEMVRNADGDAVAFCTSNETDPNTTDGNATAHWPYKLSKLTQYWRVPAHDIEPDLRVRVNARRAYWASEAPILGGIAFENFEVRQRYVPGQTFIFGISEYEPWILDRRLAPLKEKIEKSPAKDVP